MRQPLQKQINVIYTWCVKRIDPEKREQWEAEMLDPLPWQRDREPTQEQIEKEGQDFMNFLNQHGKK